MIMEKVLSNQRCVMEQMTVGTTVMRQTVVEVSETSYMYIHCCLLSMHEISW